MTLTNVDESRYTLLLSAEQCAEHEEAGDDWIRDATPEEVALVEERHPGMLFDNLAIDQTGRPYYWKTLDGTRCPAGVLTKASCNLRVFRW